jgi:hypothetical protein
VLSKPSVESSVDPLSAIRSVLGAARLRGGCLVRQSVIERAHADPHAKMSGTADAERRDVHMPELALAVDWPVI